VFDAARARTLWLQQYNNSCVIVFTSAIAVKAILLILEAIQKTRILRPEYQIYPPEATSGIINRSFFWWLNALFLKGFSKTLLLEDLFSLDEQLLAEYLQNVLDSAWKKGICCDQL